MINAKSPTMSNNKVVNVSSRWTVIVKYFVPTLWISFFGALALGFFKMDEEWIFGYPATQFKIGFVLFLLTGVLFFYWAFMGLKRVEVDDRFLYVTNYRKAFRYPFHNVDKIEKNSFLIFNSYTVFLKEGGSFGDKFTFIAGRKGFKKYAAAYPEFKDLFEFN